MFILDVSEAVVYGFIFLAAIAWIIPIVLLIMGLKRLKTRPENAKILIAISGIWLLVGAGFCGGVFY